MMGSGADHEGGRLAGFEQHRRPVEPDGTVGAAGKRTASRFAENRPLRLPRGLEARARRTQTPGKLEALSISLTASSNNFS